MARGERFERAVGRPAPEVLAGLSAGLSGSWHTPPPAGGLVGSLRDNHLQARLPSANRRFPAVLDALVQPAGRGSLVTGRVRRSALVVPLMVALALFEVVLVVVALVAYNGGGGGAVAIVPVLFALVVAPAARLLLRVPAGQAAALVEWLDGRLSAQSTAGTGA